MNFLSSLCSPKVPTPPKNLFEYCDYVESFVTAALDKGCDPAQVDRVLMDEANSWPGPAGMCIDRARPALVRALVAGDRLDEAESIAAKIKECPSAWQALSAVGKAVVRRSPERAEEFATLMEEKAGTLRSRVEEDGLGKSLIRQLDGYKSEVLGGTIEAFEKERGILSFGSATSILRCLETVPGDKRVQEAVAESLAHRSLLSAGVVMEVTLKVYDQRGRETLTTEDRDLCMALREIGGGQRMGPC